MNVVKGIACLAMMLIGMAVNAQPGVFYFTHIPDRGDTTLTGWLYHEGDDMAWAGLKVNENGWDTATALDISSNFFKRHKNHLGWFRLKMHVPGQLRNRIVGIAAEAGGATEVYLNGKLVRQLGVIDSDPSKVIVVNNILEPFPVSLSNDSVQVLAVRMAYDPHIWQAPEIVARRVFTANIGDPNPSLGGLPTAVPQFLKYIFGLFVGLNLVLAVLHGSFFRYYKGQKRNLYYSLYAFFSCLSWLLAIMQIGETNLSSRIFLVGSSFLIIAFSPALFTLTIYSIFGYKPRGYLIGLLILATVLFAAYCFVDRQYVAVSIMTLSVLYQSEGLRVAWIYRRMDIAASRIFIKAILLANITGYAAMFLLFIGNPLEGLFVLSISGAILMLMMSVAIARQLADTNIQLKSSLAEVKDLARANEQILTRQNQLLEEQVATRTDALNRSLLELKSTQTQLIHAEKMASLGELTAGIAHEIQNPLNFVNNFSDINVELIEELQMEADNGKLDQVKNIARDIRENELKINHHGRRADSIVKGMLQHSRSNSQGEKQLTDLNKLCDEYLRLSYHGIRAKDKSFNATIKTDFAIDLPLVNVHPQDIGRVVLNLLSNAFYAVHDKKKTTVDKYEPEVMVKTSVAGEFIELSFADNGNGVPQKLLDKIFQPFFTTKPTGEGTGLGLSLSYEIVKAHGGELRVSSPKEVGAEFVIRLPGT